MTTNIAPIITITTEIHSITVGISFKIKMDKRIAKKLRKKHFCMVGTSPASRINKFIKAKQAADAMINKIPKE